MATVLGISLERPIAPEIRRSQLASHQSYLKVHIVQHTACQALPKPSYGLILSNSLHLLTRVLFASP